MKRLLFSVILLLCVSQVPAQVTFSEHVASIIYTNCTYCHRQGSIAPFTLENYNDVYKQRYSIRAAVDERKMPPWPPDPKYTRFAHERLLTSSQIATIKDWVDNGAMRGDSTKEPAKPTYTTGSQLSNVDLTKSIPSFTVSSTEDQYRCFVIPSGLSAAKVLTGLELLPANRKIVHHILLYYDTTGQCAKLDKADPLPGYAGFGGVGSDNAVLIGGWVPGAAVLEMPKNMGMTIPKGADLVMQVHYAPGNKGEKDSSSFNMQFSTKSGLREVYQQPALNHFNSMVNGPLSIPANTVKKFQEEITIPFPVTIIGLAPHMHLIGQDMVVYAVKPSGDTVHLIRINHWDFHWQGWYSFKKAVTLPMGTSVYAEATYDNTTNNPDNPNDPPKLVTAGENTSDEMMLVFFSFLIYQRGDENLVLDTSRLITDIHQNSAGNSFAVDLYPNPSSGKVTLQFVSPAQSRTSVLIYNTQGVEVFRKEYLLGYGEQTLDLSLGNFPSGTYMVRLQNNEAVITRKLVLLRQ